VKAAADGTEIIVSPDNPVSAGDVIVIYSDGLGSVNPQAVAGSETPISPLSQALDPVTVTMGGVNVPVLDAAQIWWGRHRPGKPLKSTLPGCGPEPPECAG